MKKPPYLCSRNQTTNTPKGKKKSLIIKLQSNMNNERTISVSEKKVTFFVSWENRSEQNTRKYSREFPSIEAVAKFICKHPERAYIRIYESKNWYEQIENFMGFAGIHLVSCGNVVREFSKEDFLQSR